MMDEPISKEFQSEELVGNMSEDLLASNQNKSSSQFDITAEREELTSNSLCVFSERQRHKNRTSSPLPASSKKYRPPVQSNFEERSRCNSEARISMKPNAVPGPHIDSLGPSSASSSSSVSNEADGNPSSIPSETSDVPFQLPTDKKERNGRNFDHAQEFSDAAVNSSAELSHGVNHSPPSNIDSTTGHVPPPIQVPTSNLQNQKNSKQPSSGGIRAERIEAAAQ
jgi:hypothetical protein